MKNGNDMFIEERQVDIVKRINEQGRILVTEIQELYQVSADCARRDLRALEKKGMVTRTYGGAIAVSGKSIYPSETYNPSEVKEIRPDYLAVAKRAVLELEDEDVVYITASLVGYYMAMYIPEKIKVTALTNSIAVAEILRKKRNVSVVFLGGAMSQRGNCHDYYTIQMVKNMRIDKAFLSHAALDMVFGASIHDAEGVAFGRAIMENSSKKIGLYPSSKIGKRSIHSVCKIEEYDLLITDEEISDVFLAKVKELGACEVYVARRQ